MMAEDFPEKQDLPKIVIISVSVIGVALLLVNIGLVLGYIYRKKVKQVRGSLTLHIICAF